MTLSSIFSRSSRLALNANKTRRIYSTLPFLALLLAGIFFGNALAGWVWLIFVVIVLIVTLVVGDVLATKDAAAVDRDGR